LCCENGHPNFGWTNFVLVMNQMEATCQSEIKFWLGVLGRATKQILSNGCYKLGLPKHGYVGALKKHCDFGLNI
jgi:hypothetical protein